MARQLRLEYQGALYYITARGNGESEIFVDDDDRQTFLELLGREVQQQGWLCYGYCLLNSNYHLLIETPEANLSRGMRRLNGVYTQTFNRRYGRDGHLFQGRYKSVLVEKKVYMNELCRFIVLSPVYDNLAKSVRDWRWSSYKPCAGQQQGPQWLHSDLVVKQFGADKSKAVKEYRQYVKNGLKAESPLKNVKGQIFLGSEAFIKKTRQMLVKYQQGEPPPVKASRSRLTEAQVIKKVAAAFKTKPAQIKSRDHSEAYQCAAYLLRRAANLPLNDVASIFNVSPSRISHIQRTIENGELSSNANKAFDACKISVK